MKTLVTTTHLEVTSRSELRPARAGATTFQLVRAEIPCPELNRFLYTAVGWNWWWYSRLPWDYARWRAYLERPELDTWVAYVSGTPAGYFELERQPDDNVELAYFGVMPSFIGKGFGGELLTAAIARAWDSRLPRRRKIRRPSGRSASAVAGGQRALNPHAFRLHPIWWRQRP